MQPAPGNQAWASFTAPRRRRGLGVGGALLIIGIMFAFMGLLFRGMCLPADGILCQGTGIGEMGVWFLMIGALPLFGGIALMAIARRRAPQPPIASTPGATAAVLNAELAPARLSLRVGPEATPAGPVPSNCPNCGGPVARGAAECQWCGQTFQ